MKNIVDDFIKKIIDDDIQETITVTIPDTQYDNDDQFRPITLDSNNNNFTPDERLTLIYIEDNYVVQDPQKHEDKNQPKKKK